MSSPDTHFPIDVESLQQLNTAGNASALWFAVTLDPALPRRGCRAWFRRLRRTMARRRIAVVTHDHICCAIGIDAPLVAADRRDIVGWLVDEPPVRVIHLNHLLPLLDAIEGRVPVDIVDAEPGEDVAQAQADMALLVRALAGRALLRWLKLTASAQERLA